MAKRTDLKKIMIIGSGPIVIGQAAEFVFLKLVWILYRQSIPASFQA